MYPNHPCRNDRSLQNFAAREVGEIPVEQEGLLVRFRQVFRAVWSLMFGRVN